MPVFTAIAASIAVAVGVTSAFGIAAIGFGVRMLASIMVTSLLSNRNNNSNNGAGAAQNSGARVQLPPATDNKLAVVYGSAFISPTIVDAKISSDQKVMWYVCALTEVTDSGTTTFDNVYWGDKQLTFDATDRTKVISWTDTNGATDDKVNGNMYIYLYSNGSNSPTNSTVSAIDVLSDEQIEASQRWNGSKYTYTDNGVNYTPSMYKVTFAVVKLVYNQEAGITGMQNMTYQMTNTLTKPGAVIFDYLTNDRYGCGIPSANINTTSLTELDAYSDELIYYVPTGGSEPTAYRARYRINGPLNTGNNCLSNFQQLADACDSWIVWNEITSTWGVVINQSYLDYTTFADLFLINSSCIIGGVEVIPVDLNSTYNSIETQFPNSKIKDQTDYQYITLDAVDMSPNEPFNRLTLQLPQVNNSVQANYIATRRLIQSREDLIVNLSMDYSGIQIDAGDVVKVTHEVYGWIEKLFRVLQVQETKGMDGSLGVRLNLSEYSEQVYENINISDYDPEENTGISDPNNLGAPSIPTLITNGLAYGNIRSVKMTSTTPTTGLVMSMDFNLGSSANISTHTLVKSVTTSTGIPFAAGVSVSFDLNDLPPGVYYGSVTARNPNAGRQSASSAVYSWAGPGVTTYDPASGLGGVNYDNMNANMDIQVLVGSVLINIPNRSLNTVKLPVLITSTSQRNIPVIVPGTTVASNKYFPYAQGTATVAENYQVNSTGPYAPANASVLLVADSELQWYKILYVNFATTPITVNDELRVNYAMSLMSDVDTIVQVCPGYMYSNNTNAWSDVYTEQLASITLVANIPQIAIFDTTLSTNDPLSQVGIFFRNIVAGTNVTTVQASLTVYKGKKVFAY